MLQDRGVRSEILLSPDGEPPSAFMSLLSAAERRSIVRITGGCADMSNEDAHDMTELFREAFADFAGALLIGGTRMLNGDDLSKPIPGITEVGPAIRQDNASSVLLGVVGRADSISFNFTTGLVIERSKLTDPYDQSPQITTIIHPSLDAVVILGKRLTKLSIWHDEAAFCAGVTEAQRLYAKWSSVLVVYNGGATTEYEAKLVAKQKWPVVLINNSGRAADRLASDNDFLAQSPSVIVCDKEVNSFRDALVQAGAIDPPPAQRLRAVS